MLIEAEDNIVSPTSPSSEGWWDTFIYMDTQMYSSLHQQPAAGGAIGGRHLQQVGSGGQCVDVEVQGGGRGGDGHLQQLPYKAESGVYAAWMLRQRSVSAHGNHGSSTVHVRCMYG